jgi:hypothetical protein
MIALVMDIAIARAMTIHARVMVIVTEMVDVVMSVIVPPVRGIAIVPVMTIRVHAMANVILAGEAAMVVVVVVTMAHATGGWTAGAETRTFQ